MKRRMALCFEELEVFQEAREITKSVYQITRTKPFANDYGLVNQIRRAAVSIPSNIAEGYERGSKTEFIQFLFIAKGSCGEVRTQLYIAGDLGYIDDTQLNVHIMACRRLSARLSNFIKSLQASAYSGEKKKR